MRYIKNSNISREWPSIPEDGPSWMDRLPRLQPLDNTYIDTSDNEIMTSNDSAPGLLLPVPPEIILPRAILTRQRSVRGVLEENAEQLRYEEDHARLASTQPRGAGVGAESCKS
jgi:hypothetical protein